MSNEEYELIKFNSNWADEMDVESFYIKPKGYMKEFLSLSKNLFKVEPDFKIYIESNQYLIFNEIKIPGSGNNTFEECFSSNDISIQEKETFDKFFKDLELYGYGNSILYSLEDYLLDSLPSIQELSSKDFPIFYKILLACQ